MLAAQVLTVAALGRAAYLGFLRRRPEPYEHLEPPRTGARVSLIVLAAGCVASGVFAPELVRRVVAPATASLLSPAVYAHATLSTRATFPISSLEFDYANLSTVLTSIGELAAGLLLLVVILRRPRMPRVLDRLGATHTGSVNDYAGFLVAGLIAVPTILFLAR
jgi:multicomponent Na+:H+ antiporter subunit D